MYQTTRLALEPSTQRWRRAAKASAVAPALRGAGAVMGAIGAMVLLMFARLSWACTGTQSCLFNPETCGACTAPSQIVACKQPKTVHLTIDDGPFDNTPTALQILAWKQVKATFFVVGAQIAGREAIMRSIHSGGHNVASHSNTHAHLGSSTTSALASEIDNPTTLIRNSLASVKPNYPVTHFRPPYGECPTTCSNALKSKSLVATYWNIDSQDWQKDMALLASSVDGAPAPTTANPGLIMLIHLEDNFGLCALPTIIDRMRFRGYTWVSADECWGSASGSPPTTTFPAPTANPAWPACTVNSVPVTGPSTNPCDTNNGGCMSIATCSNPSGTTVVCTCPAPMTGNGISSCTCPSGYYASGSQCIDINECATYNGGCASTAVCTNTAGSRTCACRTGFTGNGVTCTNINECETSQNGGCFSLTTCADAVPDTNNGWTTRTCSACPSGYTGNAIGYTTGCVNINECTAAATPNGGCSQQPWVTCTDHTPVPPEWRKSSCGACPTGYSGDGYTCSDVDECSATPKGGCSALAGVSCFNTVGSYFCAAPGASGQCASASACRACPVGYNGDGWSCVDIDECATGQHTCLANAKCTNNVGGFTCTCRPGLRGDGVAKCENINECEEAGHEIAAGGCDALTDCTDVTPALTNGWTTRTCSDCPTGYSGNGTAGCVDINECATNHGGCSKQPLVTCTNTPGSRTCGLCPVGYERVGDACIDINECATANGGCFVPGGCTNTNGSRACGACPTGLTGNGVSCTADVQCTGQTTRVNGGCDVLSNCTSVTPTLANAWTAVSCGPCPDGFSGTGDTQCIDIDDCASSPCLNGGRCADTGAHSFRCDCADGFEGSVCGETVSDAPSSAEVATIAVPAIVGGLLVLGAVVVWRRKRSGAAAAPAAAPPAAPQPPAPKPASPKPAQSGGPRARLGSPRPTPHILSVTSSPVQSHI